MMSSSSSSSSQQKTRRPRPSGCGQGSCLSLTRVLPTLGACFHSVEAKTRRRKSRDKCVCSFRVGADPKPQISQHSYLWVVGSHPGRPTTAFLDKTRRRPRYSTVLYYTAPDGGGKSRCPLPQNTMLALGQKCLCVHLARCNSPAHMMRS